MCYRYFGREIETASSVLITFFAMQIFVSVWIPVTSIHLENHSINSCFQRVMTVFTWLLMHSLKTVLLDQFPNDITSIIWEAFCSLMWNWFLFKDLLHLKKKTKSSNWYGYSYTGFLPSFECIFYLYLRYISSSFLNSLRTKKC